MESPNKGADFCGDLGFSVLPFRGLLRTGATAKQESPVWTHKASGYDIGRTLCNMSLIDVFLSCEAVKHKPYACNSQRVFCGTYCRDVRCDHIKIFVILTNTKNGEGHREEHELKG